MGAFANHRTPVGWLRARARHVAISMISGHQRITGKTESALCRNRVHFLYLHNVKRGQESRFRTLLTKLEQKHRFISYSEAVERVRGGQIDAPYITFSFDDGFAGCRRAANLLQDFGASAAFFICPKLVGRRNLDEVRRFFRYDTLYQLDDVMNWDDIDQLLLSGHEVGSHTMSHPNLAQVSTQQLKAEIGHSFEVLKKRLGNVSHFAWPYGRFHHFSSDAATAVFDAGFSSCASAERGCHSQPFTGNLKHLCLRRENVELDGSVEHHLFFIARSSQRSNANSNLWPPDWQRHI